MRHFLTFSLATLGLSLAMILGGCSKNHTPSDISSKPADLLNKSVDQQLQKIIERRKRFLGANPLYAQFIETFQTGRLHLVDGRPKQAYETFDALASNRKYAKFPEAQYLRYFLALSLYDMDVKYGSLLYFVDIIEKQPLLPYTHDCLEKAIHIAQEVRDDELIIHLASKIKANKVPIHLREAFRYYIGKSLYRSQKYGQALRLLGAISPQNQMYMGAQYLQGTIYTDLNKYEKAIEFFQKAANHKSPVAYYANKKIKTLSYMALGRIFHEKRNYPLSILYYKKVDRASKFYPRALYEASWGLFKLHKFNESLSVLHSLHSPFIETIYFTKSYLLKAGVFMELCHYDRAVETLSEVEKDFMRLGSQIDRMAKEAQSPRDYYPLLKTTQVDENGDEVLRYQDLFMLSGSERDFLNIHSYFTLLKQEQDVLETLQSRRATAIARLIKVRERSLSDKGSFLAGKTLLNTRQIIEEYLALKDLLKYEVINTERRVIQKRSLELAPPIYRNEELARPEFSDSLKETMVWWEVRGNEYWADEVGYYLYQLPNRCKDEELERREGK